MSIPLSPIAETARLETAPARGRNKAKSTSPRRVIWRMQERFEPQARLFAAGIPHRHRGEVP
jgi:hypothetical protein